MAVNRLPDLTPLIDWFFEKRRSFNWRESNEPYKVWVSEVMSQQTRAGTVGAYFARFMDRFPTVADLAAAPEVDVLKAWEGLGYYSRARNLQRGARMVVEQYGGKLPGTAAELRKIPGIGAYTAGAIASFCFGEAEPAVDGNAVRIVSRLLDLTWTQGDVKDRNTCYDILKQELHCGRYPDSAALNEAFMTLGALVCIPRSPKCGICPVADRCRARESGRAPLLPVKKTAKASPVERLTFLILIRPDGKRLVSQRPAGLLGGMWEFPCLDGHFTDRELRLRLEDAGFTVSSLEQLPGRRHIFSHLVWDMEVWEIRLTENRMAAETLAPYLAGDEQEDPVWLDSEAIARLPFSAALAPYRAWT